MKLAKELETRGLLKQTSIDDLEVIFDREKRVVYHGIDPTADSAHVGSLVNWVFLKHLIKHGHKVVFLVGGGTGLIGDPKSDAERTLLDRGVVLNNVNKIKKQAEKILGNEVVFVDNYDWLGALGLIDFLRDIGKHFTVNEMIKKEVLAKRLESETGLSYTEFAYPLLQSYDYLKLFREYNCTLQIGGSDQWGNMVSGVDLIRRVEKKTAYVATVPLVVDKVTGKKFGKSEGNAVWLDAEKTSPFAFYQFWLNTADENVIDYLKFYTFISLEEIKDLEKVTREKPEERRAQKVLAKEVTSLVHGAETFLSLEKATVFMFSGNQLNTLSANEKEDLKTVVPRVLVAEGSELVTVLVESGLSSSKREARTFIESGAVTVDGIKITDINSLVNRKSLAEDLILLKRGKRNVALIEIKQ